MKRLSAVILFLTHLSPLPGLPQNQRPQEEQIDYYKKWLEEDVRYIIVDDERAVFGKLNTDDERDAFIEQFWRRRDTDPATAINEFREEHYRRIAYANDRFRSGIEGWATDRGRIYITFGPPTISTTIPADTTPGGRKRGAA